MGTFFWLTRYSLFCFICLGQFPDLFLGVCRTCSHNCKTCIPGRPYDCLSCNQYMHDQRIFLKQSRCVFDIHCGIGFFANKTSSVCQMCPYPCSKCKADVDCENCFTHYVNRGDERCLDECPSGTYLDSGKRYV